MADETIGAAPASTDSAPVADAAPDTGPTAESTEATHLEAGTADATTAEASDTSDDDGDEDESTEGQDESQTEEERRLSRSERRKLREQTRLEAERQAAVEAYKRQESERAEAAAREAKARADEEAFYREFGELVGTPETRQTLQADIDRLTGEVARLKAFGADTDLEVLEQHQTALGEKILRRAELDQNAGIFQKLEAAHIRDAQNGYAARAARLPEEHRAAYLSSVTIPQALDRFEAGIVAREAAKAKAEVDRVTAEWSGKLAKEEAAHARTRTGAPGNGPAPNGANGTGSGGALTLARYNAMSFEERQSIPSSERDAMMARHRAGR